MGLVLQEMTAWDSSELIAEIQRRNDKRAESEKVHPWSDSHLHQ